MPRRLFFLTFLLLLLTSPLAHAGVNLWTSNGPNLPSIQALAIAPTNAQIVYAGTDRGLFKSPNGGISWLQRLNPIFMGNVLIGKSIQAIAVDPKNAQTVYVSVASEGVYKSTNGGVNWTLMKTGLTDLFVNTLVIDPVLPTTVYAGASTGVFKSNNGAENWGPVNTGLAGSIITTLAIDPTAPATLYAGTTNGVYKTINGGGLWTRRSTGLPFFSVKTIAIAPSSAQTLYLGTDGGGVFKSSNGAGGWSAANIGFTPPIFVNTVVVDPNNPQLAYAGIIAGDVFRTVNGGTSWTNVSAADLNGADVSLLALHRAAPRTLYAVAGGGLFKTVMGGMKWTAINTGFADTGNLFSDNWRLALDPTNSQTIYAGSFSTAGGVYKSTNGGASWIFSGMGGIIIRDLHIAPSNAQHLYAATGSGVYQSTNGGGNWTLDNDGMGAIGVNAIALHPTNPLILYAATDGSNGGGVFCSNNGGDVWFPCRTGLLTGLIVSNIIIAPSNLQVLYASSGGAFYKTSNGGVNWSQVNIGNGFSLISDIVVDPNNAQIVYVAANGFYKNTNGGSGAWTPLNTGLPSGQIYTAVQDPSTPNTFYVGVDGSFTGQGGVFKSMNGGTSWTPLRTGLAPFTKSSFTSLAIDPTGSVLHVGSLGVFDLQIAEAQLGAFRSRTKRWLLDTTMDGLFNGCPPDECPGPSGLSTDLPVASDIEGLGVSTVGLFRPSTGAWFIDSGNGKLENCVVDDCLGPFGTAGDRPVSGDWFGLGYTTIGVFRPNTGRWYLDNGNGKLDACAIDKCLGVFGRTGDLPVVGDWRGVGRTLIGVFRPSTRQFLLDWNANGRLEACTVDKCVTLGLNTDLPAAGDWFGLGRASVGLFRPSNGRWFIETGNFAWQGCLVDLCTGPFGQSGDQPVPGAW